MPLNQKQTKNLNYESGTIFVILEERIITLQYLANHGSSQFSLQVNWITMIVFRWESFEFSNCLLNNLN